MILYPAIDLKSGKCVRLKQGDFNQTTFYHDSPIDMAKTFKKSGASWLHVVDLEGAQQGRPIQTHIILALQKTCQLSIQTGGGIRRIQDIETLLNQGIQRVVIGSIAVEEPQRVAQWIDHFGPEKIVIAMDIQIENDSPSLATHGWQTTSSKSFWELLDFYHQSTRLKHILCTDIQRDGMLKGPNTSFYSLFKARYPQLMIQASGGISSPGDITQLKNAGLSGAIIGKVLYEKRFSLSTLLKPLNTKEVKPC